MEGLRCFHVKKNFHHDFLSLLSFLVEKCHLSFLYLFIHISPTDVQCMEALLRAISVVICENKCGVCILWRVKWWGVPLVIPALLLSRCPQCSTKLDTHSCLHEGPRTVAADCVIVLIRADLGAKLCASSPDRNRSEPAHIFLPRCQTCEISNSWPLLRLSSGYYLPCSWMAHQQIQNGSQCPAVPDTISHWGAAAVQVS